MRFVFGQKKIKEKAQASTFMHRRLLIVQLALLCVVVLVIGRSLYLQIVEQSRFENLAQARHSSLHKLKVRRGKIFDATGELLAASTPIVSAILVKKQLEDPQDTAETLAAVLSMSYSEVVEKIQGAGPVITLKKGLTPEERQWLKEIDLSGVRVLDDFKRVYPLQSTAVQLIGFTGRDDQGLSGLEFLYNSELMGRFKAHAFELSEIVNVEGANLHLSIQHSIQYQAEKEIKKTVQGMRAKSGIVVIQAVETGAVLAMAHYPSFDPNRYFIADASRHFNRAVGDVYEPGSTFKLITMATARQHGIVDKEEQFFCENGAFTVGGHQIQDTQPSGILSLEKIIQRSSNICAAKIGLRIPKNLFYQSILDFGFNQKTGINLPGETAGLLLHPDDWVKLDVASLSFGHTIGVSAVQMSTAVNAIANRGVLMKPYVVNEISTDFGDVLYKHQPIARQVLDPEIAAELTEYMVSVTEVGGTGYSARISGIPVAGKTGTARKFKAELGRYSTEHHTVSFVGFLPAYAPRLTILVLINEPTRDYLNTRSAAPTFKRIAEKVIHQYP